MIRIPSPAGKYASRTTSRVAFAPLAILIVALASFSIADCAHPPPTLSPVGVRAFNATRAVAILDVVRDTAIAAEAARPQLLSTASTRAVVDWHRAAVAAAGATPQGWQAAVLASLDGVERTLAPAEKTVLAPYFVLVRTILREV